MKKKSNNKEKVYFYGFIMSLVTVFIIMLCFGVLSAVNSGSGANFKAFVGGFLFSPLLIPQFILASLMDYEGMRTLTNVLATVGILLTITSCIVFLILLITNKQTNIKNKI